MSVVQHGRHRGLLVRPPGLVGPEVAAAALADWLFWNQGVGLSFAVFCTALALVAHLRRPPSPRRGAMALVVLAFGLAPAVEHLDPLSVAFALIATGVAAGLALPGTSTPPRAALDAASRWIAGPRRFCRDVRIHVLWTRRRRAFASARWTGRLAWVLPLTVGSVFLGLLADANPLIAEMLSELVRPTFNLPALAPRVMFWIGVGVVVWPVLRPRRTRFCRARVSTVPALPALGAVPPALRSLLFGEAAIRRALLLCNGLFALQLVLDGAYLWAGAALPHGMTYAEYAHRGAYPLVLTALIAGGLVLLLGRERVDARHGSATTGLLLLFAGQNVLLVGSAARRLGLYVGAYGLTEWRLAAFCWMAVVACGLVLIAAQVAGRRSNGWIASRVALVAVAVLYGWGLADVPGAVARYDVAHCAEVTGAGPALDVGLVLGLGPSALPAIDAVRDQLHRPAIDAVRSIWARAVREQAGHWRTWSFRAWRLARWLDNVDASVLANGRDERQAR